MGAVEHQTVGYSGAKVDDRADALSEAFIAEVEAVRALVGGPVEAMTPKQYASARRGEQTYLAIQWLLRWQTGQCPDMDDAFEVIYRAAEAIGSALGAQDADVRGPGMLVAAGGLNDGLARRVDLEQREPPPVGLG